MNSTLLSSVTSYIANSLKLHALSHADTPSEDLSIHSMKAIKLKLDLGLEVVTI